MSTKIGLISDVHASPGALQDALDIFDAEGVDGIVCAGDIAGYFDDLSQTIELLKKHSVQTVIGNHDQAYLQRHGDNPVTSKYQYLESLPPSLGWQCENKAIYCVHAEPPREQHGGIKLLDQQGRLIAERSTQWAQKLSALQADVLIVGHTHQVFAEYLGDLLVVNPGSTAFNHSCMTLTLPELEVRTFALEGKAIIRCWNFSMLYGSGAPYPRRKS